MLIILSLTKKVTTLRCPNTGRMSYSINNVGIQGNDSILQKKPIEDILVSQLIFFESLKYKQKLFIEIIESIQRALNE